MSLYLTQIQIQPQQKEIKFPSQLGLVKRIAIHLADWAPLNELYSTGNNKNPGGIAVTLNGLNENTILGENKFTIGQTGLLELYGEELEGCTGLDFTANLPEGSSIDIWTTPS